MKISIKKTEKNFAFVARNEEASMMLNAGSKLEEGNTGFRPMETVLVAVGTCMAIDIMQILVKQRQSVNDFEMTVEGERKTGGTSSPFTGVNMHLLIAGKVDEEKLQKAIDLSKDKYCSVYHSLHSDINLNVSFSIQDAL